MSVAEIQKSDSKNPVVKLRRLWMFPVPGSKGRFVPLQGPSHDAVAGDGGCGFLAAGSEGLSR